MTLYEIILSLEGKSEKECKWWLRQIGVDKAIRPHILGCYKKKSRLLKKKRVGFDSLAYSERNTKAG